MEPLGILALVVAFVVAIVFHESAHAYVADRLGDPTARMLGRVTLNPIPHIDMFGTLLVPGFLILIGSPFLIGWAKPVPVNPYNFANPVRDRLLTALAGPASNLLIAVVAASFARLLIGWEQVPALLGVIVFINLVLMIFNLIPVPPLDGSTIIPYLFRGNPNIVYFMERHGFTLLVVLLMVHFLTNGMLLRVLVFEPVLFLAGILLGTEVLHLTFSLLS